MDAADLIAELGRPEAYDPPPAEVGLLQTHISLLFFAGQRVYKVKKSVDLGFLDFTTLERRRHFCGEEVRLNGRLAPGVYRGVVPIVRGADGALRVSGAGEPLEWAVEMARLPAERMLDRLLEEGEIDNAAMNGLAGELAGFHRDAASGPDVDEHGSPEAVARNVLENFEQTRRFVAGGGGGDPQVLSPRLHAFLEERARAFLESRRELLERRVREGRVREGHGDLHSGNVCLLPERIVIYDRIEFGARFRCGDVACDLAFLAMDLDHRGFAGFSRYLARRWAAFLDDTEALELLDFYKGYRAMVRAKVSALTAVDPGLPATERDERVRAAMAYAQRAAAYELPPALVLTCGLPATGKSWAARALARPFEAVLLRSDVRRKTLAGVPQTRRPGGEYGLGTYSAELTRRTYRSLLERAEASLRRGRTVVVDATFSRREQRAAFREAASRAGAPWVVVHLTAREALVRERLEARDRDPSEISDADWEVYRHARRDFEPPDEVPPGELLEVVSGAGPPEELAAALIERLLP